MITVRGHKIIRPSSVPLPSAITYDQANTEQQTQQDSKDYINNHLPYFGYLSHSLQQNRNNSVVKVLSNGHSLQILILSLRIMYVTHLKIL